MNTVSILLPVFAQYGHIAVFLMLLACGLGLPFPEDITLVAGGIIAGLGYVNETIMLATCLLGVLIGDATVFGLGSYFGKHIKRWVWTTRLLNQKRLALAKRKSAQHSDWILFTARFLPGLRAAIFLTAGMSHHVKFWRFLLIDGIAAIISVPLWVYLGIYGAKNIDWVMQWVHRFQFGALIVLAIGIVGIILLLRRWYKKHQQIDKLI